MRVYVKKRDKNPFLMIIILGIIFTGFGVITYIVFTKSERPFIEVFSDYGIMLPFGFIFFIIGIYIIANLFKPAKKYKLRLISKKQQVYKGKIITYMGFSGDKEKEVSNDLVDADYKCFTIGENNLKVDNDYSVKIKEFNWCPKSVEELDHYKNDDSKKYIPRSLPLITISIVFCGVIILLCIIGMILYPKYILEYVIWGIINSLILYIIIKEYKN